MKMVVINHVTLDGVMQAPGDPQEDTRGGFTHGGWAVARNDPAMFTAMGERMSVPGTVLLLGRRSYESMLGAWNERGGPFKEALNGFPKYVVSHSSATRLPWPNSHLIHGDIPAALAELKTKVSGNIVLMGSGALIRSLLPLGLIDEYLLMIHPIVLGSGERLFGATSSALNLNLSKGIMTPTGVIIGAFEPAR